MSDLEEFLHLFHQLEEVTLDDFGRYAKLEVAGQPMGYLWHATSTVGLKQTRDEQEALVAERPEVFETQFTAGQFGWVVVKLVGVDRGELAELVFESWRLSAPARLTRERGDRLPE